MDGESSEHLVLRLGDARVPLGFVLDPAAAYLIARERSARWPVSVLRDGVARLEIGDRTVSGAVDLVSDPETKARVLERFRTKYGEAGFARWYQHPARVLRVAFGDRREVPDDAERYRAWLRTEFDNVADDYDRHILGNRINRLLRDRSLELLRATFAPARRLLEIGCGSGMETLPLLEAGHELLCADLSPRMLEVVRAKARARQLGSTLETRELAAGELERLLEEVGPGAFDGAFSTYGALNCEADLARLPPTLHALLRPGARFVAGVYNRWCLDEVAGYLLTGRWRRAFGRAARPVRVGASRFCVDVFAYSPASFARRFDPWFTVETWRAVPALLPPSDLVAYAEKFSRRFEQLDRWDAALARRWPFRSLGDHFLMTLRRAEGPERGAGERGPIGTSTEGRPGRAYAAPGTTSASAPEPWPVATS